MPLTQAAVVCVASLCLLGAPVLDGLDSLFALAYNKVCLETSTIHIPNPRGLAPPTSRAINPSS